MNIEFKRRAILPAIGIYAGLTFLGASFALAANELTGLQDPFADGDVVACSACCDCGTACCDCGSMCCGGDRLLGLFARSQPGFDRFISPMTNPVFFEDPRTVTEARTIYLHHRVPAAAAGGEIDLIAIQLRAALTERLSIVASKDGYATSSNPLIDDGWADVAAGLKYNLIAEKYSSLRYL